MGHTWLCSGRLPLTSNSPAVRRAGRRIIPAKTAIKAVFPERAGPTIPRTVLNRHTHVPISKASQHVHYECCRGHPATKVHVIVSTHSCHVNCFEGRCLVWYTSGFPGVDDAVPFPGGETTHREEMQGTSRSLCTCKPRG